MPLLTSCLPSFPRSSDLCAKPKADNLQPGSVQRVWEYMSEHPEVTRMYVDISLHFIPFYWSSFLRNAQDVVLWRELFVDTDTFETGNLSTMFLFSISFFLFFALYKKQIKNLTPQTEKGDHGLIWLGNIYLWEFLFYSDTLLIKAMICFSNAILSSGLVWNSLV